MKSPRQLLNLKVRDYQLTKEVANYPKCFYCPSSATKVIEGVTVDGIPYHNVVCAPHAQEIVSTGQPAKRDYSLYKTTGDDTMSKQFTPVPKPSQKTSKKVVAKSEKSLPKTAKAKKATSTINHPSVLKQTIGTSGATLVQLGNALDKQFGKDMDSYGGGQKRAAAYIKLWKSQGKVTEKSGKLFLK